MPGKALVEAGSGFSIKGLADIAETMQRIQHDRPGTALPGCGHFLQEDEPERVGQLIAEFFNSAPG